VWFVEELRNLAHRVKSILSANVPMETLSSKQWKVFCNATQCHVCDKPFTSDDTRVRDHCHLTGRYRGPAHSNCLFINLNYKDLHCIPIVFHNLSGYDAHFIIKEIATVYEVQVELLPITKEKYISFTKNVQNTADNGKNSVKLQFIDLYKFLNTNLDKLTSFLNKDKLRILQHEFFNLSAENFDVLTRKGIFPYEYIDCVEKLEETSLSPRESFYIVVDRLTISYLRTIMRTLSTCGSNSLSER